MEKTEEEIQNMEKELNELRPLKDTTEKLQTEFKQKEDAWQKEKADLEGQQNPNWQKARQTIDALKEVAKSKGVSVDDEGRVISNPQNINIEEIRREAASAAKAEILGGHLQNVLSQYDEESGKLVKHYFDKITAGETVTLQNIDRYVTQAESAASADPDKNITKIRDAFGFSGGQGPRSREEKQGALDDATAKDLGEKMGLGFATNQSKK